MSEQLTMAPTPDRVAEEKRRDDVSNEVLLAPFWTGAGSPFPDSTIPFLYSRTKEDGLLRRVFPGQEEISLVRFIELLSKAPVVIGFEKKTNEVMAYSFLTESSQPKPYTRAMVGFCYFRKFWRHPGMYELARQALQWWFYKLEVAVLYGTILESNRTALQFARGLYFREIGTLPMFFVTARGPENVVLLCLTREEFRAHFTSKFGVS